MQNLLAQIEAPATAPATQTAAVVVDRSYDIPWEKWVTFRSHQQWIGAIAALLLILIVGAVLVRIFKRQLERYQLTRITRWAIIGIAIYSGIALSHPRRILDPYDILSLIINKSFVALMLLVLVRYIDRIIVLPLLTRVSRSAPSRIIHQIIIFTISFFVLAGYISWAFGIEIGSFLAGSAILSIIIGLALQETLGNFFSGMVLQAAVPFKPGDWIQIGDVEGRVIEMTWRAVTVHTLSNNHVLIPNSVVAKDKITNFYAPSLTTGTSIAIGLDYSIPPNEAKRALIQAALDVPGVLPNPGASLVSFEDSAILYKLNFSVNHPERRGAIEEAVRVNVWYRVNQARYNIPFPIRTVEITDPEKRTLAAHDSAKADRLAAIQKSPLFAALAPDLMEQLAEQTRDFTLAAGQTFYRQNDQGNSLFVLMSGTISSIIRIEEPGQPPRDIDAGDTTAPAVFGEISALTSQPRGATQRAKTDVRAMEIDQSHLKKIFDANPQLMEHFSQAVAKRTEEVKALRDQLGAPTPTTEQPSHPDSILHRMKRLFNFGLS
jgi:small-conductance mechanosensitive channel